MEDFKKEGRNIQLLTTDIFSEEYSNMLKQHQTYLYENITKIIEKYFIGINKNQIESLIDRYLLTDLKYRGKQSISKLEENLETVLFKVIDNSQTKSLESLLKIYLEEIKTPIRRNQLEYPYEITPQFSKQLSQTIEFHLTSFKPYSSSDIGKIITDIDKDIQQFMNQYQSKFTKEYQSILTNFINNNKQQITSFLEKITLNQEKSNHHQLYSVIVNLSGYELIEENNQFYAEDKTTKERIALELHQSENLLTSQDNKLRYFTDSQKQRIGYYNNETKVSILVHNGLITLIPPIKDKQNEKIYLSFAKKDHNYQLYYNLKLVTNLEKIKVIIAIIEKYGPGIYSILISDPDFQELLSQIKTLKKTDESTKSPNQNNEEEQSPNNKKH